MGWNLALNHVRQQAPAFNDYLLKQCRAEHVDAITVYIDTVFKEAMKLFPPCIQYQGYKALSPEKQVAYLLDNKITKGRFNVQKNELQLVEFFFTYTYENESGTPTTHNVSTHIFLPYLHHGSIVVNDTANYVQLAIIERVIYRLSDCVIIKLMRSPTHFWRTEQLAYTSIEGRSFFDAILTVKIHQRSILRTKKDMKTTLLLYSLTMRGLAGTLEVFGVKPGEIYFTEDPSLTEGYLTFNCAPNLFIKVAEKNMSNITHRRIVASLLYMLSYIPSLVSLKEVNEHPEKPLEQGNLWQIILGKSIFGINYDPARACAQAQTHLASSVSYLDPMTKLELKAQGIKCNDIFELCENVFENIDTWLINHAPNDLYEKKIGILELLAADIVKSIFTKCYHTITNEKKLSVQVVNNLFKLSSKKIAAIYSSQLVRTYGIYGDNELLSLMSKKVRQPANQNGSKKSNTNLITAREHRFHPSFVVVESILAVLSNRPGVSGSINPYAPISTTDLYFQRPNYAADIDAIYPFLPSR